jgi:hypothetical protein
MAGASNNVDDISLDEIMYLYDIRFGEQMANVMFQ